MLYAGGWLNGCHGGPRPFLEAASVSVTLVERLFAFKGAIMGKDLELLCELKPGEEGTKILMKKYGDALVCVRLRYDEKAGKRFKTVELIEEQADWTPPPPRFAPDALVPLRIAASDMSLRAKVKAAGGRWVPEEQLWYAKYGTIAGGPLERHIHIETLKNRQKK
jgi:hypothetical protein